MRYLSRLMIIFLLLGCAKEKIPVPEAATLLAPADNDLCTTAQVIDATQSQVTFQWSSALHTDSYTLYIENKNTGQQFSFATTFLTKSLPLARASTYSWWVVSQSEATEETGQSAVWTFYLEGAAQANSLPYPAFLISPADAAVVSPGTISLQWNGRHPNGAPLQYEVYVGTQPTNMTKKAGPQTANAYNFQAVAGSNYYWQVIAIDPEGDESASAIYHFQTED